MARAARPGSPAPEIVTVPDGTPDAWLVLKRQSDVEETWTPYHLAETTATQARNVRAVTGQPLRVWLADLVETAGRELDSFAVFQWLARMQNGEPGLTLREVEEGSIVAHVWVDGISLADEYRTEATRPEAPTDSDLKGDFPEA